jgi:hypothetical protein
MSYLPAKASSFLSRDQQRALEAEFSEMKFIELVALAAHAAGSYISRHIALEYAHTMRTLEDMSQALSPQAREQMRTFQERYTEYSRFAVEAAYIELLERFHEVVSNPTAYRQRHHGFRYVLGEVITGLTWDHVDGHELLK